MMRLTMLLAMNLLESAISRLEGIALGEVVGQGCEVLDSIESIRVEKYMEYSLLSLFVFETLLVVVV